MSIRYKSNRRVLSIAGTISRACKLTTPAAMLALASVFCGDSAKAQTILGTAQDFAVLAGSTVTNTGPTVINGGSVGVWPGSAIVGFPPGIVTPPGTINAGDAVAQQAQNDLTTAYNFVAGLPSDVDLTGQDLGGLTLSPAVYSFTTSAQLTGVLTLDGQGDPDSEFFFQIGSTLTTASNSAVLLINGANGNNVYWQVGSSATLGTNTVFAGNILADQSITLNTGATITCGRALARNAAVTLDTNVITICATGGNGNGDGNGNGNNIPIDELGGEGVTGTEHAALDASTLFGSVLLGQVTFWRDRAGPGVNGMAPDAVQPDRSMKDGPGLSLSLRGGPGLSLKDSVDYRNLGVWATGFGGHSSLDGDAATASPSVDSRTAGFAAGFDYQIDPSALVGIAGGYTHSDLAVDDPETSGTLEGKHLGLYGIKEFGPLYLAGTAEYARFDNEVHRTIDWLIDERAEGEFTSELVRGQIEAGWRQYYNGMNVTPFAGLDVAQLSSDGYVEDSENTTDGTQGILGLSFESRSTTSVKSSLGLQLDTTFVFADGSALTPFARIAWVHEFKPEREVQSFLTASPGATFSFDGADAPSDVGRVNAGLALDIDTGLSLFAAFDGEFSDDSQKYAGSGGLKISW